MIRRAFRFLSETIASDLGFPLELRRVVTVNPALRVILEEPAKVVSARKVVGWDRWKAISHRGCGVLQCWSKQSGNRYYSSSNVFCPALENIVQTHTFENFNCDIQEVEGLAASKSPIEDFSCMDEFVIAQSPEMIDEISDERLQKNLRHHEIRILREKNKSDYFTRHQWDGRLFLMNSGGSHHFAAARLLARRIGRKIPLSGKLYDYRLNASAINSLRGEFEMFAISEDGIYMDFFHAMEHFQATFCTYGLPRPYMNATMILLPKSETRSQRVATVLQEEGFFDIGRYLQDLANRPVLP